MRLSEGHVARACLAVMAAHVLDDSFVQPQPGTSAVDHLVSGLVPVAILAVVAWLYPSRRAGARGAISLGFGAFGIATGIEGAYYTRAGAMSGDDATGLAALVAGVVLIALGCATLWRSRKGGSRRRRFARRALLALGGLVVAYLVVYPISLAYVATHVARTPVEAADLGAPYEEVSFATSDGLELDGWYVPSQNRAAVIAVPGRSGPQPHARMLVRHGYGVLLFDRRGEGTSEGSPNALGWEGDRDIAAAIEFLRGRDDVDETRIGGLGLSVGGEMLIDTAATSEELRAVVSEGAGIRSAREARAIPDVAPRIQLTALFSVVTLAVAVFSDSRPPPSLADLVSEVSPRALFLIDAERGQGGETELTETYYEEAGEPKKQWTVPGSTHTGGIDATPAEYERRVVGFYDEMLLDG